MTDLSAIRRRNCFVLDLDGVVYAGSEALPGAVEAVAALRRAGKRVGFLTNNSGARRSDVAAKLRRLGIPCDDAEVMTASVAAAEFCHQRRREFPGIYAIASDGLRAEFATRSVSLVAAGEAAAVVVGLVKKFPIDDVTEALEALDRGVPLIICNRDARYPGAGGRIYPGCGALVAAVEAASGRRADFDVGKPNPDILRLLLDDLGATEHECVIVGDGLDSDIALACAAGVPSILIADGEMPAQSRAAPTCRLASLAEVASNVCD